MPILESFSATVTFDEPSESTTFEASIPAGNDGELEQLRTIQANINALITEKMSKNKIIDTEAVDLEENDDDTDDSE